MEKAPAKTVRAKKMLNRDQRELDELPAEIEKLEAERTSLLKKLEDPALYQNGGAAFRETEKQFTTLEKTLATRYARWEELEALRISLAGAE